MGKLKKIRNNTHSDIVTQSTPSDYKWCKRHRRRILCIILTVILGCSRTRTRWLLRQVSWLTLSVFTTFRREIHVVFWRDLAFTVAGTATAEEKASLPYSLFSLFREHLNVREDYNIHWDCQMNNLSVYCRVFHFWKKLYVFSIQLFIWQLILKYWS